MIGRQKPGAFPLGFDLLREKSFRFSLESLMQTHTRVQGSTGSGKSRLLLHLVRAIIAHGYPLVLIDGKGDLVDSVERDLAHEEEPYIGPDRVAIIDPADTQAFAPGFNPIALDGREPYARAKSVLGALKKVFHEEDETKPWLSEIVLHSLVPLERAELGILELATFLQNERFREAILAKHGDHWLEQYWRNIEDLPSAEKHARFSAALTRASLLWSSGEGLRRIFGQLEDSLDWGKILSPGGILLVNANSSRGIDSDAASFLGTIVFQKIIETASRRPKHDRVPTFIIVDEFARFASSDVVEALELLRGFGVHLILAHQYLEQLEDVPRLLGAVESCAQNRIVFSTSAPDAERLQAELFTGFLPERKVIQEIHAPVFAPKQRWVDVVSHTENSGSEAHVPEVVTHHSGGRSVQHTPKSRSRHYGAGDVVADSETIGDPRDVVTESDPTETRTPGYTTTTGPSSSVTRARQFITEYEERSQLTTRQLETLEELKEHGREALMRQPRQHCFVQLQHEAPTPLRVAHVEDADVSDRTLEFWKHLIYRVYPRGEDVDRALETRVDQVLEKEIPRYATNTRTTSLRIATKTKSPASPPQRRKPRH